MTNEKILEQFSDGVRMIMLCQRNKEGRNTNKTDRASIRKISTNKEEFLKIYNEFLEIKNNSKEPLRIYSSVNKRDINKAIRTFKFEQLEADYYDEESRNNFYFDIKNRWISCLTQQKCKLESNFLIDADFEFDKESKEILNKTILEDVRTSLKDLNVEILLEYPTKSGFHLVTKPFNPSLFPPALGEIKKDALLLLSF